MRPWLTLTYLAAVHALLGMAVLKSSTVVQPLLTLGIDPPAYRAVILSNRISHQRRDRQVPPGADVFLGDSLTASMVVANVSPVAVNFGIGGQRTDHLLEFLPSLHSLGRAGRVFLMIGTNDVVQGRTAGLHERYDRLLAALPAGVPVVMSSAPPVRGREVQATQAAADARAACSKVARCTFVDVHAALRGDPEVLEEDGVHLSAHGYEVLRKALTSQSRPTSSPSP